MADKTKSQTYNFLLENKTIEDIKQESNIEIREKSRHGGKTFKLIVINNTNNQIINDDLSENNRENLEIVATNLTDNEKEQKTNNDFWTKLTNYLNWPSSNTEETSRLQSIIQEKDKNIKQLKKQIEELNKSKQGNITFNDFKYNAITIYDEKQSIKTGIDKIYEEILPIEDKIIFITTFVHIDNSITEEIIHFQQLTNSDIKVFKQNKYYLNINEYKKDFILCENQLNNKSNVNIETITIKDFLKKQQDFKLKPTKKEWKTWSIIIGITLFLGIVAPICTFAIPALISATATVLVLETKVIIAVSFAVAGIVFKEISSLYENATQKVKSWFKNKYFKNKDQKEKEKNEREARIKILTSDKPETKLETQFKILKQELDNRKNKNPDQLMTNNTTIDHNSNSLLENSSIESENNQNFDSFIKNTVNHQDPQPSTNWNHNWNKVKCLLT
ncbi:hypothetical protein [Spiroplasma endosymbiont of Lariophagus distinguendus]|uniref:hypothetical protein n=1 Tax=Spiroplasma endosymbiont of Lariophagus distinguendus TaxID=2935082 RepID=UPI00207A0C53|nr:hypothetical protein [Spiroplasma endosymbiont of Lariophagus distinguendus]